MIPYVFSGQELDRPAVLERLRSDGAVLLRGLEIGGVDGFDRLVRSLTGAPLPYTERSSPRSTIKGQVYTSTDYPPTEEIFVHNENSYQASWPRTLYFHCVQPPTTLGATPLADIRLVYQAMDESVRAEFVRRGWMVVRNFHEGFGVSWQHIFDTEDRDVVTEYCARNGIEAQWLSGGLRTKARREAVHRHPETGEPVWFNHATFFHVSSLPPDISKGITQVFARADLPTNTYYGDGGEIPDDVLAHLRDCYRSATERFDWQRDDVLLVDNMLVAHGREPYTGPRKIAVAMTRD